MSLEKIINEKYFTKEIDLYCFKELLKTYWCFDFKIISKEEFVKLRWKILTQKDWNIIISIYSDITFLDIIHILDVLEKKLDKDILSWFDHILLKSKISILKILKNPEEKKELDNILKTQKISKRLIDRILWKKLDFTKTKHYLKQENISDLSDVKDELFKEFELLFFRLWIKNFIKNLTTFSKQDYLSLKEEIEKNSHLISDWDETYKYDISEKILIYFRSSINFLSDTSKKITEKLNINDYKKHLKKAKKTNNLKYLHETEYEIITNILKEILNYPFSNVNQKNWYKMSQINQTKEIYCVWFCLIAHWLFKELWIKHNALIKDNHILLEVYVGDESYYFETTDKNFWLPKIVKKEKINQNHNYFLDNWKKHEVEVWDAEKSLLSSILNNNSMELNSTQSRTRQLEKSGKISSFKASIYSNISANLIKSLDETTDLKEILEILNKALELSPNYTQALILKSEVYIKLKDYENALLILDQIIEFDYFNITAYYKKYYINILKWEHKKANLYSFVMDLLSLDNVEDIIIDDNYTRQKEILLKLKVNWLEMLFNIVIENS